MGIEVWTVIVPITVLSMYLLPLLVRCCEMARRSNVQSRYSAELRILTTGAAIVERDDAHADSGYAEIFRRRPEMKMMNGPTVKDVRAPHTKCEFDHVHQVHARGRKYRRTAASHRGIAANILLGVSLGVWVLGLVTALPWWPTLLPSVLLGISVMAGHRAALASIAADHRERRRTAELKQTLVTLTGRRSSASVVAAPRFIVNGPRSTSSNVVSAVGASAASSAALAASAESVKAAGDSGAQDSFIERLAREGVQRSAAHSTSTGFVVSTETAADTPVEATGTAVVRPSRAVDSEEEHLTRPDTDLDDEVATTVAAEREIARRTSVYVPFRHAGRVTRDMGVCEAVSHDGDEESLPCTKDFTVSLPASTSRGRPGRSRFFAEVNAIKQETQRRVAAALSSQVAAESARRVAIASAQPTPQVASRTASEPARLIAHSQTPAVAAPIEAEGVVKEEATTSTPPQGWQPIHVLVSTYTLAARVPRYSYADSVIDPDTSAPVSVHPQSARVYILTSVGDGEELFHPIDLDIVLEGRRATNEQRRAPAVRHRATRM